MLKGYKRKSHKFSHLIYICIYILKFYFRRISFKNKIIRKKRFLRSVGRQYITYIYVYIYNIIRFFIYIFIAIYLYSHV